jgi:hypothetical protein
MQHNLQRSKSRVNFSSRPVLNRQSGLEKASVKVFDTATRRLPEAMTFRAVLSACFQSIVQAAQFLAVRPTQIGRPVYEQSCRRSCDPADGTMKRKARRWRFPARRATRVMAMASEELLQRVVRAWHIRQIAAAKQAMPVTSRDFRKRSTADASQPTNPRSRLITPRRPETRRQLCLPDKPS